MPIPDWCELTDKYGPGGAVVFGYDDEERKGVALCPFGAFETGDHAWQPSAIMPWHWILEPCSAVRRQLHPDDVPAPAGSSEFQICPGCGDWLQRGWHMEEHESVCADNWWD